MRSLLAGIRKASKLFLLVVAVAVTITLVGRDARPAAGATGTSIIINTSSTSPIPLSTPILMYANGPSVDLYVWATNIKDPFGPNRLGGFDVYFTYDNALVSVTALNSDIAFLEATGRQASCVPPFWASFPPYVRAIPDDPDGLWEGTVGCHTLDGATPFGPAGTGLIASLTVTPNPAVVPPLSTLLDFAVPNASNPLFTYLTVLIDTGGVSGGTVNPPAEIAATVTATKISMVRCADFDASGTVDLFNDIVGVIQHFGTNEGGAGWDPIYDLDESGNIDLFNDIVGTIVQFGMACTQPA